MALLVRSTRVVALLCWLSIHHYCQQHVLALIAPKSTKVRLHYGTPRHCSTTRLSWLTLLASSPEDDDANDDDGWGNVLPVEAQPLEKRTTTVEPERDLFIPIFAIVSIAGLLGSYGYEMLRLQANGELYLPWTH